MKREFWWSLLMGFVGGAVAGFFLFGLLCIGGLTLLGMSINEKFERVGQTVEQAR